IGWQKHCAEPRALDAFLSSDDSESARARRNPQHFERELRHQVSLGDDEQGHTASDAAAIGFRFDRTLSPLRRRYFRQAAQQVRMSKKKGARIDSRFED